MPHTLTVNGTAYNQSGRRAASYLLDGWGWDLESGMWCEFHEHTSGPQPVITGPRPVSLSNGTATLFAGDVVTVRPAIDSEGRRTWGYRCLGLEYRANWIPVTANDGSGLIRFNVDPTTNPQQYVLSFAGQSIGQILSYCLALHSGPLAAAGITTDATTAANLAALTLVPNTEVQVAGERLWSALQGVCQKWMRNIRLMITGSGLVRAIDITTGAGHTLTMGTDPIDPPLFSRNWTTCATRMTVRGQGRIYGGYVSILKGTLSKAWSPANESAWVYSDFTNPTGPTTDKGTVTSVSSPTTVVVQSSDATRTWATNYWDGILGWIQLFSSTGSALTYSEARPVSACGAMTAGGTCTITLGYALENSGTGAYDSYQLIGNNVSLANGGLYDVWRLFNITDPGSLIADHLVSTFSVPQPFVGYDGQSAQLTAAPTCQIVYPNGAGPMPFVTIPQTGQVLFTRPILEACNITSTLKSGVGIQLPTDVYMLLAYSRGALTTTYPPDVGGVPQYSGTAFSAAGLSRTATHDQYDWGYAGNISPMTDLAQMLQVSLKNTITEGTIAYKGLYTTCEDPTGGHLMSIAGDGYTTGDESLNIPVRSQSVRFFTEGGGLLYHTTLRCSTRQDPRTGEGFYDHLAQIGQGGIFSGGAGGSMTTLSAGGPTFAGMTGFSLDASSYQGDSPNMAFGDDTPRRRRRTRLASSNERQYAAAEHDRQDDAAQAAAQDAADEQNQRVFETTRIGGARSGEAYDRADEREGTERLARKDSRRRARRLRRTPRPGELVYGGQATGSPRTGTDLEPGEEMAGSGGVGPAPEERTAADRYLNGGDTDV